MKLNIVLICLLFLGCATHKTEKNEFADFDSNHVVGDRLPAGEKSDIFYANSEVALSKLNLENEIAEKYGTSIKSLTIYKTVSEKAKFLDVFGLSEGQVWLYTQFVAANKYQVGCYLTIVNSLDLLLHKCKSEPAAIFENQVIDLRKINRTDISKFGK